MGIIYLCAMCYRKFSNARCLVKHRRIHKRYDVFSCNTCRRMFSSTAGLRNHLRRHAIRSYHCPICFLPFQSSEAVKSHYNSIHGSKPDGNFCRHCGFGFLDYDMLLRHEYVCNRIKYLPPVSSISSSSSSSLSDDVSEEIFDDDGYIGEAGLHVN